MDLHLAHVSMERPVLAGGEAERGRGIQIPGGDGGVFGFGHAFAIHKRRRASRFRTAATWCQPVGKDWSHDTWRPADQDQILPEGSVEQYTLPAFSAMVQARRYLTSGVWSRRAIFFQVVPPSCE